MPIMKQIYFASVLICALLSTAAAQDSTSTAAQRSSLTITASAAGERVRITAPSSIVQMHVEVYAPSGEKLFDQEIRGGNVFDWHLQDGQAQRLAPGAYVCVVTAKSVSGKLTQKIGTVKVAETSASVQPAGALSAPQAQTIGPVEENSSWTIPGQDEPQTTTVIAHDGTDGQMIRGRGALTFRIGNFFSGIDSEQMRLTEEGNLGIGTSEPKAKLDVAGTIRAERFLIVKPKLASGDKTAADTLATDSSDSVQSLATGTGTQSRIAKWIDGAGTLGDSGITEAVSSNVGIGTTTPGAALEVFKTAGANVTGGGVLVSRYNDGAGTFRGGAIYSRFISAAADDALVFGVTSAGTKNPYTDFDQARMAILAKGNVGIGTTAPVAPLDIFKSGGADTTSGGLLLSRYNDGAGTVRGGAIYSRYITAVHDDALVFAVTGNGTKNPFSDFDQARMIITSGGNVGIGTTTPLAPLDVRGNLFIGLTSDPSSPGGNSLFLANDAGDLHNSFRIDAAQNNLYIIGRSNTGATADTGIIFRTATPGGGEPDQVIINGSGKVGIGTDSPQAKLDVRGDVKLGSTGQLFAPGGEENLRIVRGVINADGTVSRGSGFQATRNVDDGGAITYTITFDTPFPAAPIITVTPFFGPTGVVVALTTGATAGSVGINLCGVSDSTNIACFTREGSFHFMVIGPR